MGIIQGREKMSGVTKENLLERIQNYFESGGLWNPECMSMIRCKS